MGGSAAAGRPELPAVRGAGTPDPAEPVPGSVAGPEPVPGAAPVPSPGPRSSTVPAAEANRSSTESPAAVGPVSSVVSSYSWLHQSSS
ncbi:hypothetical protein [Streptomyces sp. NPDC090083]|uniref:hypothetical protein n=1 Tax=Streptomyces sp. NPDC090083 TaxID=3365941 RepID=UPI0038301BF6